MVVPQQLKFPGEGGDVIQELTPPSGSSATLSADAHQSVSSVSSIPPILSSDRGRGHPRKDRQKPMYSDFPVNETLEEQEHWFKAKMMEIWRYNKLNSVNEEQYRQRENTRTTKSCYDKKKANPNAFEFIF